METNASSKGDKMSGVFEIARIPNCFMMGLAVLVGEFMTLGLATVSYTHLTLPTIYSV